LEHSIWLSLIRDQLEIIQSLLSDDGSLWITIDDNEAHYLKVLCDEVFGQGNFVANVIWEKLDSPRMDAVFFSSRHDHVLVQEKARIDWVKGPIIGHHIFEFTQTSNLDVHRKLFGFILN
jgi:adenine-specific DNA-methyltransferase